MDRWRDAHSDEVVEFRRQIRSVTEPASRPRHARGDDDEVRGDGAVTEPHIPSWDAVQAPPSSATPGEDELTAYLREAAGRR